MSAYPILWSFRRCPYAMRARLAIKASGQQVELREILLRDKPAPFIAASAKATVPVLVLSDGQVIEESREVMGWALSKSDPEGWLDEAEPESLDLYLDRLDGPFKTDLDRYKYAARYAKTNSDKEEIALAHRHSGATFIAELDEILRQQPALSGAKLGLRDYATLPFIRQFRIADPDWFDAQDWPALQAWLQAFLSSSRFEAVMEKYTPWQEGQAPILF